MMRMIRHRRLTTGACVLGGALTVAVSMLAAGAPAASGAPLAAAPSGAVSPTPASGTPELTPTTANANVRQIVQCGNIMYAVGQFSSVTWNGQTFARNNAFSFLATSPYTMQAWNPDTNGIVDSVALNSGCTDAYLGGAFNTVGGTSANDIAEVNATSGALVPGFAHDASAEVFTLLLANGHLLAGGNFKIMNGNRSNPYYISLSPSTGKNDGYLNLNVSGHYVYPNVANNTTSVYNQQLSHNGNDLLAEGVFTSVGGQARQQIFMLSLGSSSGTVTPWTSSDFNGFCSTKHPFYVKAAAWGPGDSTVYVADTGNHPDTWNGKFPLVPPNMCDVVAAFPATQGSVSPTWTNYSGCDSFFSVAADGGAVYAGGHERWADNQFSCNSKGKGAIPAKGMGGFVPGTGALITNSAGTKGLYQMSRGNADDMLRTGAGLWIASSNRFSANQCGGVTGHTGICFLPNA